MDPTARRRALRQPAAVGAAPVLRARDARRRADAVGVVRRPAGDRAVGQSVGADHPLVRHALHAARARPLAVHGARSAAGAGDRRGAGGALSRHPEPAHHRRARRSVPRRDRGSLRRRVPRPPALRDRGARGAGRSHRLGHRAAARRGALELREPADFHRRAAARHERRSLSARSCRRTVGVLSYRRVAGAASRASIRLADGVRTVFLANSEGRLLDIIDIERWASRLPQADLQVPCARPTSRTRARRCSTGTSAPCSARRARSRCSPRARRCSRSAAPRGTCSTCRRSTGCGRRRSATRRWRCGCFRRRSIWPTRARARCSSSCAIRTSPCRSWWRRPIASTCRSASSTSAMRSDGPSRRDLLHLLEGRSVTDLDPSVLAALASLDGATVVDRDWPAARRRRDPASSAVGRARCRRRRRRRAHDRGDGRQPFGPVLKVSEDGVITFFDRERVWDI